MSHATVFLDLLFRVVQAQFPVGTSGSREADSPSAALSAFVAASLASVRPATDFVEGSLAVGRKDATEVRSMHDERV
jgi:hypothetical protein